MNILIIGAGVVGTALAEQLSQEGHRVVVVDRDRSKVQDLNARFDVLAVHGSGSRLSVLHKAGVESAELVIAVTDVDEVNIVVGMMAAKLGVKHRIVRVRNREFAEGTGVLSLKELGIDHVINPDPAIVNTLVRMIDLPGAVDVASLSGGQVLMLGFDISEDSPAANRTPAELREAGDLDAFLILDIQRGDEVFVAKGHHRLLPGDNIHVLAAAPTVPFVLPILHRHPRQTRRVIIVGASRIGLALALAIEKRIDRVVLIEPDGAQAHEAADLLSMTTVLRGTGTDLAILEEAAVDTCDLFCALSDDDQRNMLAALLARKHGAAHTAVVV
ncbi:MAG: Trk system potassium transporter TrkA, partial [Deltaproteobacteria bacterium]|nr:Trk system potassium transporter TrkA [Deltaproteobacteria bacterium]